MGATGSIHLLRSQVHFGWNRDHPPLLSVASGAEVTLETQDASGGQFSARSTAADVEQLDFERHNPPTPPTNPQGAPPANALQVKLLKTHPGSWAPTAQ